ncbi:MAG: hypothetical protein Q7K65_05725 [Candidatus Buchananbacteria bacterium]|nr:hypothetical protein [Candidatus Buchananbacteria bacterium]
MEQKETNKNILGILGLLLILGTLKNITYIGNWSTAQMIGFNVWTLVAIFGGAYLAYRFWPFKK